MKKKLIIGIVAALLAVLGLVLGASAALGHDLWDTCRKTDGLCYYPGDCRSYIDTNNDGICDRSQPEPETAAETATPTETTGTDTTELTPITPASNVSGDDGTSSGTADAAVTPETPETVAAAEEDLSSLSRYFLLPVLVVTAVLYGVTWMLSNRKKISVKLHRRIWNIVLLIATVISALLGVYLILEIDFGVRVSLPFDPLFWHVEAGIAMAMVAVFHIAWHWRYFQKMLARAGAEA